MELDTALLHGSPVELEASGSERGVTHAALRRLRRLRMTSKRWSLVAIGFTVVVVSGVMATVAKAWYDKYASNVVISGGDSGGRSVTVPGAGYDYDFMSFLDAGASGSGSVYLGGHSKGIMATGGVGISEHETGSTTAGCEGHAADAEIELVSCYASQYP